MTIQAKRRRRLTILAAVIVLLGAAGTGTYFIRMRQAREELLRKRAEGMAALKEGNYFSAMHALGTYINRIDEPEPEALYKYALARRKVEEPNGKHLLQAAGVLRRLLVLRPGHIEARRDLLDLYLQFRYSTEAVETADIILKDHPDDPQALQAKAVALGRLGKFDKALALAERYNQLKPLDTEGQELTFTVLRNLGRGGEELIARARRVHSAHPDDPRSKWLMALAHAHADDRDEALKWCRATARDDLAPALAGKVVNLLDRIGARSEAFELLERTADAHDDPRIGRKLARRLWEDGRYQQLIKRFSASDAARKRHDSETLGLLAASLIRTDRRPAAEVVIKTLEARKLDNRAAAWACVLKGAFLEPTEDPLRLIDVWEEALGRVPGHPYFNYFVGNAYAAIGETGQALGALRAAARAAPAWPLPLIQISRLLLSTGRPRQAAALAREVATRRAAGNLQAAIAWAETWDADTRAPGDRTGLTLEGLVDEIQKALPNEPRTLPIKVKLLARAGKTQQAGKIVRSVVESGKATDQKLLLALAQSSRIWKLGLEDECLRRCEQIHGRTPEVAFARARRMARAGQPEAGLETLQGTRKSSGSPDSRAWRVVLGRYHESTDRRRARDAWVRLARAFPEDPQVQQLVLAARSVWSDRGFVDRTIERLKKIVGDRGVSWRLPRARWLARHESGERRLRQAAALLTEAIALGADGTEIRTFLAECHERLGNTSAAVEHLTVVANRLREPGGLQLRLAALQYKQGDARSARSTIQQMLQVRPVKAEHLRRAAALLAGQGELAEAISVMKRVRPGDKTPADMLLLAGLYHRRNSADENDLVKVEAICEKLMKTPSVPAICFVADFHASRGRAEKADSALAELTQLKGLGPARREVILANFRARWGDGKAALEHYRNAIGRTPGYAIAHRLLIASHIQLGQPDHAVNAIRNAAKLCPDDQAIRFVQRHQDLLSMTEKMALRPLAVSLVHPNSGHRQAAAEILQVMKQAATRTRRAAGIVPRLRTLADRYPRFWAGQAFLAGVYRATGRPQDAAEIATRAMQSFPTAAEPAWMATDALAAAGRWAEALSAAKEWRKRSANRPLAADLKIAEVQMRLGEARSAIAQLRSHLDKAMKDPEANVHVIDRYVTAMVLAGEVRRAGELLVPLLEKSSLWRRKWMRLLVLTLPDARKAAGWLGRVMPMIPADAPAERVALAQAWRVLDERFDDADYSKLARRILADVTKRDNPPAEAFQILAVIDEGDGNAAAAEAAYRRALKGGPEQALKGSPKLALSANNLAMILLRGRGGLDEAKELATRAVSSAPSVAAYRDTLARVHSARGEHDAAIASIARAIRLQGNNLEWYVNLARIFVEAGRIEEARKVLGRLDRAVEDPNRLPGPLRKGLAEVRQAVTGRGQGSPPLQ